MPVENIKKINANMSIYAKEIYQRISATRTSKRVEKTRKYFEGVALGDAFNRSSRSLANDWNICRLQIGSLHYK